MSTIQQNQAFLKTLENMQAGADQPALSSEEIQAKQQAGQKPKTTQKMPVSGEPPVLDANGQPVVSAENITTSNATNVTAIKKPTIHFDDNQIDLKTSSSSIKVSLDLPQLPESEGKIEPGTAKEYGIFMSGTKEIVNSFFAPGALQEVTEHMHFLMNNPDKSLFLSTFTSQEGKEFFSAMMGATDEFLAGQFGEKSEVNQAHLQFKQAFSALQPNLVPWDFIIAGTEACLDVLMANMAKNQYSDAMDRIKTCGLSLKNAIADSKNKQTETNKSKNTLSDNLSKAQKAEAYARTMRIAMPFIMVAVAILILVLAIVGLVSGIFTGGTSTLAAGFAIAGLIIALASACAGLTLGILQLVTMLAEEFGADAALTAVAVLLPGIGKFMKFLSEVYPEMKDKFVSDIKAVNNFLKSDPMAKIMMVIEYVAMAAQIICTLGAAIAPSAAKIAAQAAAKVAEEVGKKVEIAVKELVKKGEKITQELIKKLVKEAAEKILKEMLTKVADKVGQELVTKAVEIATKIIEESMKELTQRAIETITKEIIKEVVQKAMTEIAKALAIEIAKQAGGTAGSKAIEKSFSEITEKASSTGGKIGETAAHEIIDNVFKEAIEEATKAAADEAAKEAIKEVMNQMKKIFKDQISQLAQKAGGSISADVLKSVARDITTQVTKLVQEAASVSVGKSLDLGQSTGKVADFVRQNSRQLMEILVKATATGAEIGGQVETAKAAKQTAVTQADVQKNMIDFNFAMDEVERSRQHEDDIQKEMEEAWESRNKIQEQLQAALAKLDEAMRTSVRNMGRTA